MCACKPTLCLYMGAYESTVGLRVCMNLWCGCGYEVEMAQCPGHELRGSSSKHSLTQVLWAGYTFRPSVPHLDFADDIDS